MEAVTSTREYIWSLNSFSIRTVDLFGLHAAACYGYQSVKVPSSKDKAHCKGLPLHMLQIKQDPESSPGLLPAPLEQYRKGFWGQHSPMWTLAENW